jgi:hypothetical protein
MEQGGTPIETPSSGIQPAVATIADQGLDELRQLIACVKQMFFLLGYGGSGSTGEQMAAAQQTYLAVSGTLRQTLRACGQAFMPVSPGASGAQAFAGAVVFGLVGAGDKQRPLPINACGPLLPARTGVPSGPAAATLADRKLHLQGQVASKNELVKQVIDQLRQMLECMGMWDAQKAQLERVKQHAER